ncbi:MAG: heavy metal-associated domain-containing protein, partial [Chloroflexota bacterium]
VRIDGLVCGVCASRTRIALERLPGVRSAHVNLETFTATLEFDSHDVHSINNRDLDTALRSVVLGMWLRRLIEHSINFLTKHSSSTRKGRA